MAEIAVIAANPLVSDLEFVSLDLKWPFVRDAQSHNALQMG